MRILSKWLRYENESALAELLTWHTTTTTEATSTSTRTRRNQPTVDIPQTLIQARKRKKEKGGRHPCLRVLFSPFCIKGLYERRRKGKWMEEKKGKTVHAKKR